MLVEKKIMDKVIKNAGMTKSGKMIELYNMGLELNEIFEELNKGGVTVSVKNFVYNVVSEYCRLNDVELRVKKKSSVAKTEIIQLLLAGKSVVEISKELKIYSNRIYKIRKELELSGKLKFEQKEI